MTVIAEVLSDLYLFAVKYRFGFRDCEEKVTTPTLWSPIQPSVVATETPTSVSVPTKIVQPSIELSIGYVCIPDTFMYVLPTRIFDGVVAELPYGAAFSIIGSQGKWLNVEYEDTRGWVHLDDVTRTKEDLEPQFVEGELYAHDHADTVTLRTAISDAFHAAQFDLPLQDVEYTSYKLAAQNRTIAWPSERPRVAGTWQRILKGVAGVHLGILPKTDTVIEYINPDNTGHVAYVEAVYPDESIFISEVGYPDEGRYHERTLTKDEWIELRPVFIEIT